MINNVANLQKNILLTRTHKRVSGTLPNDSGIEFIGIPSTKEVIWFQYGNQHSFKTLPIQYIKQLTAMYVKDTKAVLDLSELQVPFLRQLELFTYYIYGDADFSPDIVDGKLQAAENYRHTTNCISLQWASKKLTINSIPLNKREIIICDCLLANYTDKLTAHTLGITLSTLDFHKRNLYKKAKVDNKAAFILKIINERI